MLGIAVFSLLAGLVCGGFLPAEWVAAMDSLCVFALKVLVFAVGIEIASDRGVWARLRSLGLRVLLLPLGIAVGSLAAGLLAGWFMGMPLNESGAVAAGMGWYSLSAVLLKSLGGVQLGTVAFLANIFRELLALLSIPLLAAHLGPYVAIAPAGATAMDTSLPLITRCTNETVALVSVLTGVLCTALVPLLVPLLYGLSF